jgi:hypothetical protein
MMTEAVVILEVVEGMMVIIQWTNHNGRINHAVQVLETIKSRSDLMDNDPLEMMLSSDIEK